MNKMFWLIIGAVVVASVLWWWMSPSEMVGPTPTPTPTAQSDPDVEELDSINASQSFEAEFKAIDQDASGL